MTVWDIRCWVEQRLPWWVPALGYVATVTIYCILIARTMRRK